jgi:peptide/nickel transport system permease protein
VTKYIIQRLITAIPTILVISLIVFAILEISPSDPVSGLPLTIDPAVREQIRESMGVNDPFLVKYAKWVRQFLINEPLNLIETITGLKFGDSEQRLQYLSWQTRSPIVELIADKWGQTFTVVGSAYVIGILIAIPIGVISAYKQYSWFDQIGTFIAMIGFSVPTFFTGLLFIIIFSIQLGWFPMIYNTTHVVDFSDLNSVIIQFKQMFMPTAVLAFFFMAQFSRFTRSAMLDNLHQDYIRTARSKGLNERQVVLGHALRNSLIPVVTLITLGIPGIFQGALITEQIFRINGLGAWLILAIQGGDLPTVQSLTFIFSVLIVFFNIVADVLYGLLDPRVVYN